jgi:hypothetical protein
VTLLGGGQFRLPGRSFARFILMMFILFCLVMRTAYQAKQFDQMTNVLRRIKMTTIDELVDNKYTLLTGSKFDVSTDSIKRFKQILGVLIFIIVTFFLRAIQNNLAHQNHPTLHMEMLIQEMNYSNFKSAYAISSLDYAETIKRSNESGFKLENDWYFLEQRLYSSYMGLAFPRDHFLYEPFNELIRNLTETGLINVVVDHYFKFDELKPRKKTDEELILTMEQVGVIFLIWLTFLAASLIAFFGEILTFQIKNLLIAH